jgi:hypothetical protein
MRHRSKKWCLTGYEWLLVIVVGWVFVAVVASA